jgi:hypothetical protein
MSLVRSISFSHTLLDALLLFLSMTGTARRLFGIVRRHLQLRVIIRVESDFMKQCLFLVLAVFGLIALIPTESKAQVTISVGPAYSDRGYYQRRAYYGSSDGDYYQRQPYYYREHAYRYHTYRHNQRYYRSHRWHNND